MQSPFPNVSTNRMPIEGMQKANGKAIKACHFKIKNTKIKRIRQTMKNNVSTGHMEKMHKQYK